MAIEGDHVFLTFDIDWAGDEVLEDTIALVESAEVAATWFVTHPTPLLERLRANPRFELGVHPNFNFLLEGRARPGDSAERILDAIMAVVPEARAVRSHSMVQSSRLTELFMRRGLTHDCNEFIPVQSTLALRPWRLWNGLVKVPHFWEDDATCIYGGPFSVTRLLTTAGLKVFDFHPIHVFLNTEHLDRYERSRAIHRDPAALRRERFEGRGTRTALLELLETA